MNILERINQKLTDDAEEFASSFNIPHMKEWIKGQFRKGYKSIDDYRSIIKWVVSVSPNLELFDFPMALQKAKESDQSEDNRNYDPYAEINSNEVITKFDNGKKWLVIRKEDYNAICNRLQHDYSEYLRKIMSSQCWGLVDPQDKLLAVVIPDSPLPRVLGQFGNKVTGLHREIRELSKLVDIDCPLEGYEKSQLIKAINAGTLNLDRVPDVSFVMKQFSTLDIINCKLIRYTNYCDIGTICSLYSRTKHTCLLKYALAFMVTFGHTKTKLYSTIKRLANDVQEIKDIISNMNSSDTREWHKLMDEALTEIQDL